jgi:hypothetical protein
MVFVSARYHQGPGVQGQECPQAMVQGVPCTMEIFDAQEVSSKHACPTPHETCARAVADAAWQALLSWNRSRHRDLKNFIYALYPRRKKNAFMIS